jgi:hypothetical protein
MNSQAVENVLSSANTPWQFGRLSDSSPLPMHYSIPSTLATSSPFHYTNKASQIVPHSRASHDFLGLFKTTNQNIYSLCMENHSKYAIYPFTFQSLYRELSPYSSSSSQIPLFSETVVILTVRSDTVRLSTVPRTVRDDTELYNTIPGALDAVQCGTTCNQYYVLVTVPFSFVQGFKTSKRNNTHYENKYKKKNLSYPIKCSKDYRAL